MVIESKVTERSEFTGNSAMTLPGEKQFPNLFQEAQFAGFTGTGYNHHQVPMRGAQQQHPAH